MEASDSIGSGAAAAAAAARLRFVLVAPSHPGNIGAAARALRTMGFARLIVVAPCEPGFRDAQQALALAAGAVDVLAGACSVDTLAEALAGVSLAFAMTGYARGFGPPMLDVREAAARAAGHLGGAAGDIAYVFGTERTGLVNADVERCHYCCAIPTDPVHGSLNLAQAVQVTAYECRRELWAGDRPALRPRRDLTQPGPRADEVPASVEQTEAMFAHLEQALVAIGYLDPQQPRHLMSRLRRLLLRAAPSATEIDILRGVLAAIELPRVLRAGRKEGR